MESRNATSATRVVIAARGAAGSNRRFGVAVSWVERVVVLAVSGDLDMLTAPALAEALQAALRQAPAALLVDLSKVEFLAAAGMGLLSAARRDLTPAIRFGVVADGPATSRPLRMVGLGATLPVYGTLGDGLAALAERG